MTVTVELYDQSSNEMGATYQWLGCLYDMVEIDGATDQVFTPTKNENYAVIVNSEECIDTSDCYDITALTIENDGELIGAEIYPNPSNGNFNIEFSTAYSDRITVEIKDISEKTVYMATYDGMKIISVNPDISTGIYYIEIAFDNNKRVYQEILIFN